jgi:hypothetical protein
MSHLTRDEILGLPDIATKEITVPNTIPVWGGKTLMIKQLTRGQQDAYLKRQYGETRMKQDARANNQEISAVNIYGHDAFICIRGICDENGKTIFTDADTQKLNEKSGEAIGWIALQIIEFSGMGADAKIARGDATAEEVLKDEVKN